MAPQVKKSTKPEAPSLVLLALVSQFLANNGFSSSSRIFNTERKKRPKKEGWVGTLGRDFTAKFPPLETVFKQWEEGPGKKVNVQDDGPSSESTSESEGETSVPTADVLRQISSSSSSDSGSETSINPNAEKAAEQSSKIKHSSPISESDSSSDSDSVFEAEEEAGTLSRSTNTNTLKRKAADTSSSSSGSSSSEDDSSEDDSSSSEDETHVVKKVKVEISPVESDSSSSETGSDVDSDDDQLTNAANVKLPSSDSSDTSSSDDSSDSDDSEDAIVSDSANVNAAAMREERLSESSGTVTGDAKAHEPDPVSNGRAVVPIDENGQIVVKKKHVGTQPTRLAQLSAIAKPDEYISNEYISYDYAERAYRDLVVTRGKGFTKEKNKKKRGSYRGGTIDTSGGKGFKFED